MRTGAPVLRVWVPFIPQSSEGSKQSRRETFRLLHAKNIVRPQLSFREKVDNSNTPFVPKLFVKPNALKPLPEGEGVRWVRAAWCPGHSRAAAESKALLPETNRRLAKVGSELLAQNFLKAGMPGTPLPKTHT